MKHAIEDTRNAMLEAVERHEFERHIAHGSFEDYEVTIFAWVNDKDRPVMSVHVGGTFERYDDPDMRDEYAGGTSLRFVYDGVGKMASEFRELAETYDLKTYVEGDT